MKYSTSCRSLSVGLLFMSATLPSAFAEDPRYCATSVRKFQKQEITKCETLALKAFEVWPLEIRKYQAELASAGQKAETKLTQNSDICGGADQAFFDVLEDGKSKIPAVRAALFAKRDEISESQKLLSKNEDSLKSAARAAEGASACLGSGHSPAASGAGMETCKSRLESARRALRELTGKDVAEVDKQVLSQFRNDIYEAEKERRNAARQLGRLGSYTDASIHVSSVLQEQLDVWIMHAKAPQADTCASFGEKALNGNLRIPSGKTAAAEESAPYFMPNYRGPASSTKEAPAPSPKRPIADADASDSPPVDPAIPNRSLFPPGGAEGKTE